MTKIDTRIRLKIARNALFGNVIDLYISCLSFVFATDMAFLEVSDKKKKNGRVRNTSTKRVSRKGK